MRFEALALNVFHHKAQRVTDSSLGSVLGYLLPYFQRRLQQAVAASIHPLSQPWDAQEADVDAGLQSEAVFQTTTNKSFLSSPLLGDERHTEYLCLVFVSQ